METLECLTDPSGETCEGPVRYHSIDPGRAKAWPRCDKHWGERLDSLETSMERYANSDVVPGWFDPGYAGESW